MRCKSGPTVAEKPARVQKRQNAAELIRIGQTQWHSVQRISTIHLKRLVYFTAWRTHWPEQTGWLWTQSPANAAPLEFPVYQGNNREFSEKG